MLDSINKVSSYNGNIGIQRQAGYPYNNVPKKDTFQKGLKQGQSVVTSPVLLQNNLNSLCSPWALFNTYSDEKVARSLLDKSPAVKNILEAKGITPSIHAQNLKTIHNHIKTTTQYAMQIANEMGLSAQDKKTLELGCVFHDYGKILIPEEIVNKPGTLNQNEKQIMDLHASLGAEMLKSTGIDKKALDLVSSHHLNRNQQNLLSQILSVADIYSALREERSYKAPLTTDESLKILDQKAGEGEVSTEVVNALKNSVSQKMAA